MAPVCVGISIISFAIREGGGDCRDDGSSGKQGSKSHFSGEGGCSRGGGRAVVVVVAGVVAVTVAVAVTVTLGGAVAVAMRGRRRQW